MKNLTRTSLIALTLLISSVSSFANEGQVIKNFIGKTYTVNWSDSQLLINKSEDSTQKVFSSIDAARKDFYDLAGQYPYDYQPEPEEAEGNILEETYKTVSLVGSLFSYQVGSATQNNTGEKSTWQNLETIDLNNNGARVALQDYFSENDIYNALMNNSEIKSALNTLEVSETPKDFKSLFSSLNHDDQSCRIPQYYWMLTRFAFAQADDKNVTVALSAAYTKNSGNCPVPLKTILITLPQPETLKAQIKNATTQTDGFLWKDTVGENKVTTHHYEN